MLPAAFSPRSAARPRAQRWQHLLWWLVLAMLLAPALGRIHQVLHPPGWQAVAHSHANVEASPDAGKAANALLALFAGHGHADCQLLDQLNVWASAPAAGQMPAAALPEGAPLPPRLRAAAAGSAAFFNPRAPPLVVA